MSLPRGGTPPSGETPTELIRTPLLDGGPKRGAIIASKYRVDRLIARGGMGAVWEAFDTALERRVAVKFMDPDIAARPALRARFNKEAKATARLRTPHVVQVIEHGVDGNIPYIVMELLEGEDLQRKLKREKRVPLNELVVMIKQLAKGLRAAHEAGIIHRDLKPQNIFLAQHDGELCVKILDFGVAKVVDMQVPNEEGTKTGVVVGSPHYMSPEQARGLAGFDHRSDVWSLGVICFKALTGHRPFKGEVAGDVIVKICAEPIPKASETAKGIPRLMDRFFDRALERDPDRRFQNALELAAAFEDYVDEVLDDSMKTERYVLPIRKSDDSLTITPLLTPPTALAIQRLQAERQAERLRSEVSAVSAIDSKPGVLAPPDSDVPPTPGEVQDAVTQEDSGAEPLSGPQSVATHTPTPATGSSMSDFSGTVNPTAMDEPLFASGPPARRIALVAGISAGALLAISVAAMALTSAPVVKSELAASAEAAAPEADRSRNKSKGESDEHGNALDTIDPQPQPKIPQPKIPPPLFPLPPKKLRNTPPVPSASAIPPPEPAVPIAPPSSQAQPKPRPRPRPKTGASEDWGY